MRIALDAMGGDYAPQNTVAGAVMALREYSKITRLYLTGDEKAIRAELAKLGCSDPRIEIVHTTQVVEMSDAAVEAVRRKKDSSVSRAVDLVKAGDADAVVSAGHTGAAVAATTIKLRTLEGVERPGIASYLPTEKNVCVLIDAGANIDAKPVHLLQYAIMGSVLSRQVLGYANPEIGLMSIGGEDVKGSEFTKEVFKLLKSSTLNFRGNIEGHDLFEHPVEVILCDGFTGNVVLKTAEATAGAVFHWLKHELMKTKLRMLGAWIARNAFRAIRRRTNYENYGGSPLLGVNGICIIAHGSSSPLAIKNAIRVAAEFIEQQVNPRIVEAIRTYNEKNPAVGPSPLQEPHAA
jgi:glycerol-3-phosphate acyltransferase PlsX